MVSLFPISSLFLALFAPPPDPPVAPRGAGQVRIHQRIVVRVPRSTVTRASMSATPLPPIHWVERETDACVPVESLAAAAITRTDSVDLLLEGGRRLRAKLASDCPALAFYSGFYVRPTSDGKICAARDSIRSRSGGECRIEAFRALVPAR